MPSEPREHLVHWLRDAYAMEKHALELCAREAGRIENYPELKQRIAQHAEETKGQIARLDRCFSILGEAPSAVRSALSWFTGNAQAASGVFSAAEIVKGLIESYAFENLEIASYTALIAVAEAARQHEVARLCSETLHEEIAMAEWLKHHLAPTTRKFLDMDSLGNSAGI